MAESEKLQIIITGDSAAAQAALKKAGIQVDSVSAKTKAQSGTLAALKTSWLAYGAATLLVVRGMNAGIKIVADFEQSIANVVSVSGGAKEALIDMARAAGKETVFSASEAADALYFLASAGLAVTDMSIVLEPTLNLAAAAQMDIARATDIVVGNLKVFQKDMSEAESVTDVMAKTVSSANTDMAQLAQALKTSGSTANNAGIEFEDLNAILAAMANLGIKGGRAGRQLRMALVKLIKPTKEGEAALKKYGISTQELAELLPTPIKLFQRLHDANMSQADSLALLGVRQGDVFGLIKNGIPDLIAMREEIENAAGAAGDMAEVQLATLNGQLKLMFSALQEVLITLVMDSGLLDSLTAMVELFVDIVRIIADVVGWVIELKDAWTDFTQSFLDSSVKVKDAFIALMNVFKKKSKEKSDALIKDNGAVVDDFNKGQDDMNEAAREATDFQKTLSVSLVDGFLGGVEDMKSGSKSILISMIKSFTSMVAGELAVRAAGYLALGRFIRAGMAVAGAAAVKLAGGVAVGAIQSAAQGADFITSGPQLIQVGDNPSGEEHVRVTPSETNNDFGMTIQTLVVQANDPEEMEDKLAQKYYDTGARQFQR